MTTDINTDKQLSQYLAETKPLLVEFLNPAKECCHAMQHVIDELRRRLGDKANILQIDGKANEDLIARYKIATYPSYILFKDGEEACRDNGRKPVQELEHMVRSFI